LVFVHTLELMMNDPDRGVATASTTRDWVESEVGEDAEVCVTVLGEVVDEIGLPPPPT
jgi:hypothetical protein